MSYNQIMEGVVVDNNDPEQQGRIKIWIPAVDGSEYNIESLAWASYISPLAGQTRDYPAGTPSSSTLGLVSYGFWMIPKNGAIVIVSFLYGDPNRRIYLGSSFRTHGNRSLPVGRNRKDVADYPVSDTLEPIEPLQSNLQAQFQGNLSASEAQTRGAYERQVAQDKTVKDGSEGYSKSKVNSQDLEPDTYCLTTPGRHSLIFQDSAENGRVRMKSANGHQIIFDDANERIYISSAKGNNYVELDQDGRIHVYGSGSISFSSGGDFNVTAAGNFNVSATNVNIGASGSMKMNSCAGLHLSGSSVNLESGGTMNLLASAALIQSASTIDLNGPTAASAECADPPSVSPSHEPWSRSTSSSSRNPHWKA